ncbi:MAG: methionyl-tRNA formyltransferase [Kiritimatiellae bacterium]|nr:methionyl-tRNA formyltransferase [Kiritimatiellia bacterium]
MLPGRAIRVVFMGSDTLSCPFLRALAESPDVEVAAVVTQPDRGRGRHLRVTPGPVKELALSLGICVLAPPKVNEDFVVETLAGLGLDAIVVMAYGQIVGDAILGLPRLGCVNLHVSLLPRWRGAAPIQRAILAGDARTGVTAMLMDRGMDTGDTLGSVATDIGPDDTTGSVAARLCESGCALMLDTLRDLDRGAATRVPQDGALATKAPKIRKEEAFLDWSLSAAENERKVRAFSPKPGAATWFPPAEPGGRGLLVKVFRARVETLPHGMARALPGTLLELDQREGPLVAGGAGKALRLLEVLPEGRPRPMDGASFANGYRTRIPIGSRLGVPGGDAGKIVKPT